MEPEEPIRALDLFAGTGWGVACQLLGIEEDGVELMDEAVATRTANGMNTIYRDVWDGILLSREAHELLYGIYTLLIGSPPCQTFSMAGNGAGRKALNEVIEAIRLHAYKDPAALRAFGEKHDMRTALVLTPLAYVYRDRPQYVALEQVPAVLPVWEACAEVMREWGYSVETAVLCAEQYGVPQTRKRAILVARLDGPVSLPTPTHSKYYSRSPEKLDPGVKKWVSMAEALGWGMTDAPMHTITAGTHGPTDRWASGGNGARKRVDEKVGGPNRVHNPNPAPVDSRTQYTERIGVEEAALIQTYPSGRGLTGRPSPTITGGGTETGGAEPIAKYHERYTNAEDWVGSTERLTTEEAAALQTYPSAVKNMGSGMVERHGERPGRTGDQPAFTIRANAGGTEPGGFVLQDEDGTRKLEPAEASVLQTYRRPFIWCGNKSKQFLQIGNAVPPLLAYCILSALTAPQDDLI